MAKHKKKKDAPAQSTDLVQLDSTAKKLESLFTDPYFQIWSTSGAASGIRRKILSIDYEILRNIVQKVPLFNAVINTRVGQILPFCQRITDKTSRGFQIINVKDPDKDADKDPNIDLLYTFFEQTGYQYDPDREDDLSDFAQMFVRDIIEIDQVATEIQLNRRGEACAFWGLDPATINRVDPDKSSFDEDVRFVQLVELKVENEYTNKTMVFDYMNKRSSIKHRGYGYSVVEQVIDIATTLLFGYNYVRDQLVRDRVPKGFISVMGDVDGTQLDSIRRYWYAAMSGAGGQWNIPILPSGKDGVGMDFKMLGTNNKDMEYHRTMMFISSIIAAVAQIDLAELGIKSDDSQTLIGQGDDARIKSSKDRGLGSMLTFLEQHLNKILRKVTPDYKLKLVGYETDDEAADADIVAKKIASYRTINDILKEKKLPQIKDDYANVVLNAYAVQLYSQQKQTEQQQQQAAEQQQQQGGDEMLDEGQGDPEQGDEYDQYTDDDAEQEPPPFGNDSEMLKSLKSLTERKVNRFVIR